MTCAAMVQPSPYRLASVLAGSAGFRREFHEVSSSCNPHLMPVVEDIFHRILTPLYGPQDKAIGQIRESKDRVCHLLYEDEIPVGVLVFKKVLSDEFEKECGLVKSIEIKSLFVDNSSSNSGKGLGSCLIDKLFREVTALGLGHQSIHVTVSETKQESLQFFQKKGFQIVHEWRDRYISGVVEYLLSCAAELAAQSSRGGELRRTISKIDESHHEPQLVHTIHDAHIDDIHKLLRLPDGTFLSGSKDNSIIKWGRDGSLIGVVDEPEPDIFQSEANWVTDITVLNDDYFVSGTRSGEISLWKVNGEFVRRLGVKAPKAGLHFCKPLNVRRINCLATGLNRASPSFFVGFPTMFSQFSLIANRTSANVAVHGNDWVYSIHPLATNRLLTVVAGSIDLWTKEEGSSWSFSERVYTEPKESGFRPYVRRPKGHGGGAADTGRMASSPRSQRPFISSLKPLIGSTNHFVISVFDGSVQIIDLATSQTVYRWEEHKQKVWSVLPLTPERIASCGEDQTVRIWDTRIADKSTSVIENFRGQVNAMERLDDQQFVVGTSSQKGSLAPEGAEIRFYDIRK